MAPVDGPVGGPVGGTGSGCPVGGPVAGPVVVWSMVQFVVRPVLSVVRSKHALLHIQWPARFKCLHISRASRWVFFLFPSSGLLGVAYF